MKIINLQEESDRLNISRTIIEETYRKLIHSNQIKAILDSNNQLVISYQDNEMNELVKQLSKSSISIEVLSEQLGLPYKISIQVLEKLLSDYNLKGIIMDNDFFISKEEISNTIITIIENNKTLDIHRISEKLGISEKKLTEHIEGLKRRLIDVISPYSTIRISELSKEVQLTTEFTHILLKSLISSGEINASIDSVNDVLVIEKLIKDSDYPTSSTSTEKVSNIWYLVPLFLGILGGVLSYYALKDDNKKIATDMVYIGIASTLIGFIIYWNMLFG